VLYSGSDVIGWLLCPVTGCLWLLADVGRFRDRYGHAVYLTHERWHHIIGAMNHPEMTLYEEHLKETIQLGQRRQDALSPQKYRYVKACADLPEGKTHIVAIVLFRFSQGDDGKPNPNNYIVTAYMRELG
jgi:hypothetical protein